ncbi:MAG: hypothetical protein JW913_14565 [Chitinispirillaceae bacterium]|nr:hypothetical protein [Chitinispirillaceae bacterium]
MTRSLGICLGASNIKTVELVEREGVISVGRKLVRNHESNPRAVVGDLLKECAIETYDHVALTGRKFREVIRGFSITEPEAIEAALDYLHAEDPSHGGYTAVASLGAESFIVYLLTPDGLIGSVETGNKCASGTGEFFLQQLRRMNITAQEAVAKAGGGDGYRVSGRCSVFCKSDCTHALNKGIPIGRVASGLCMMMADKVMDLLEKVERPVVLAVGGVTNNLVVMGYLRERLGTVTVPAHADVFEALGAACYALKNKCGASIRLDNIFKDERSSFMFLPPIEKGAHLVSFKKTNSETPRPGDRCLLGLDVGSTTTKAVVIRKDDCAVLASVYLRTNGDPVHASRECYQALQRQLPSSIEITGLATTGSGRQIAGLHASTDAVINEIIAHATGAAWYDPEVDTIFEIGGQDAKFTHLTNAVPSDYAMNEACSAGTGSFLEESAQESLGIGYRDIEKTALEGKAPPNFNDQCAAFISSDIKIATHEGIGRKDIVAGLVYSICMNYVNRVKGQRPIGNKIFMQGGVCYNRAVPMAMANLVERRIVVPPDPGLIGAFGVAVELKHRIEEGSVAERRFDLAELAAREIVYGKRFICRGGPEGCDRGCEINMVHINEKKYPFGGACNRYYNLIHQAEFNRSLFDYVNKRQTMVFEADDTTAHPGGSSPTIGIPRSFLVNTFFPLYHRFFTALGVTPVLSDKVDPEGIKRRRSSFCYPGEIAHGALLHLLKEKRPDYLFLPKIMGLSVENSVSKAKQHQCTCVLLQSEAYYCKSAFKDRIDPKRLLSPLIDFSGGLESQSGPFIAVGTALGMSRRQSLDAYRQAVGRQNDFMRRLRQQGSEFLPELEKDPASFAIVLFGRPYNAFAHEANMGIPAKFASRGVTIVPWDMLPADGEPCDGDMCWAIGQQLMKAASYVKNHPQLFGAWITNFSCGPDSFLVGYFRSIMKTKPSLTLELDSHTADAGVNTRIEAFLDIVNRYRGIGRRDDIEHPFVRSRIVFDTRVPGYIASDGKRYSMRDKRVHLLVPSMGRFASEALALSMEGLGVRSTAVPIYDYEALKLGRAHASCKECLPLLLTTGGLLKYLAHRTDKEELLAYFMPFTPGNCRFPQYRVFLNNLIRRRRLENVCIFSLTAEKGYMHDAFSPANRLSILKSFIVSDVIDDIKNALDALAVDRESASAVLEAQWRKIGGVFRSGSTRTLYGVLDDVAETLSKIELRQPLASAKKVSLMGEIFVRRDEFSCRDVIKHLVKKGIVVKKSHFFEWLRYVDYIIQLGIYQPDFTVKSRLQFAVKQILQKRYEKRIKGILARSGLVDYELIDIEHILSYGKRFFDVQFRGESILAVGGFFKEILHSSHGVISIGPFACMPTRVIEAILSVESTMEMKRSFENGNHPHLQFPENVTTLPFLSVETDGNPFPQILEARVEAFCLQVERLYRQMKTCGTISD